MKQLTNPYLKRIAISVGEKDTSQVIRAFVSAHRDLSESLESVARKLGVSRILHEKLPFEGALFRLPDGELVIKLNAESSFVRKRFTLAHEIGHLLLNTVPAFRSSGRADAALERTCDMVAAELLMPTTEATAFVRGLGHPSPENLKAVAWKYGVSLQSAAIRVRDDFKLWTCLIGMWDAKPRVKTLWFVGPRRQVDDRWQRDESMERVWLNLFGVGSTRVLGLVDFVN